MLKLLIVEDDLSIADMLKEGLEDDGFVVTGVAGTLVEALAMFQHNPCDCAIIDIHLAHGDLGQDVSRLLRTIANIGIIFSTGNDDRNLSTSDGDAIMVKPYHLHDMRDAVRIIADFRRTGRTDLTLPRNFRRLAPANIRIC